MGVRQWVWCFQRSHLPLVLKGYSEDGGAQKGDVIPEHEFAVGPVCLDDENEFPPVSSQSNWPNLRLLQSRKVDNNIPVCVNHCGAPTPSTCTPLTLRLISLVFPCFLFIFLFYKEWLKWINEWESHSFLPKTHPDLLNCDRFQVHVSQHAQKQW